MTLQEPTPSRSLLARKGSAVPVGLPTPDEDAPEAPFSQSPLERENLGKSPEFTIVSEAENKAGSNGGAAKDSSLASAASLLPTDLMKRKRGAFNLSQLSEEEPENALTALAPDAAPDTGGKLETPEIDRESRIAIAAPPSQDQQRQKTIRLLALLALVGILALVWYATVRTPGDSGEAAVTHATPAPASTAAAKAVAPQAATTKAATTKITEPEKTVLAITPSVDVVRIEPNGEALVAGRAAPKSELIILDKGTPIGVATADAFGEWVFVPGEPLPTGSHEFGLVVKSVQGKVSIPAPGQTAQPATEQSPAAVEGSESPQDSSGSKLQPSGELQQDGNLQQDGGLQKNSGLVPVRKPLVDGASSPATGGDLLLDEPHPDFVVQLASVKTRDGAEREWRKLKQKFPSILSDMQLSLDEANLDGRGMVIRVRTGAFSKHDAARDFCAHFVAQRQQCLVISRLNGN